MKNSSIPLIILAAFFTVSTEVFAMLHFFFNMARIPLPLTVPILGSSILWSTIIIVSCLGILLSGYFIYANEEGLIV